MKTEKFATPVAMRIETQEQADEAFAILKDLGYSISRTQATEPGVYVATAYLSKNGLAGICGETNRNAYGRTAIDTYNPKLFKALAAMRSEGWGVGELVRSEASLALKRGEIIGESALPNCVTVRSVLADQAPFSINVGRLVKLTAAKVIAHFTPAEKSQEETEQPAPLTYGGDIAEFPIEIVTAMLDEQERQGNKRDVTVFEKDKTQGVGDGFDWSDSNEGDVFWNRIINRKDFAHFFARYPKATEQPAQETAELTAAPIDAHVKDTLKQYVGALKPLSESEQETPRIVRRYLDFPVTLKPALQISDSVRRILTKQLNGAQVATDLQRAALDKANADLAAAQARQADAECLHNAARTLRDELQSFINQFPNP